MDIEQLSKSQIVLLTLLVSFVTSLATGIVTVSLMDQAPPAIAQSVSRVIERTIQTVASSTPRGQAATTIVTQEKTVVIKESDLISQAVKTADPSIVRMYVQGGDNPVFFGLGVVIDGGGTIAADSAALGDAADAVAVLSDGSRVRTFVDRRDSATGVAYLRSATSTVDGKPVVFTPVGISTGHPVLGETVVVLGGKTATRISAGLITSIVSPDSGSPQIIDTDIASDSILAGAPIIDTDGSLVGVSTSVSQASSSSGFVTATALMKPASAQKK